MKRRARRKNEFRKAKWDDAGVQPEINDSSPIQDTVNIMIALSAIIIFVSFWVVVFKIWTA
jgi:hypothetical protein